MLVNLRSESNSITLWLFVHRLPFISETLFTLRWLERELVRCVVFRTELIRSTFAFTFVENFIEKIVEQSLVTLTLCKHLDS